MKNAIIVRTTVLTLFLSARAMANDRGDGIENH